MVLRNAEGALASEGTLLLLAERTNSDGSAFLVSGAKKRWRREFNDATFAEWVLTQGAGMGAWTVANGIATHTMGTTANAESTLTSRESFTAPFTVQVGIKLSQKIANNEVYIEIVAENDDGSLDETVVAAWKFAGSESATTTNARWETRNGGASRFQSPIIGSLATQTADAIYEIRLESDEVWFSSKAPNSTGTKNAPAVSNLVAPNPERRYRIRVRTRNGAVAPASSTTVTLHFVTAVDFTEQQVNIVGGEGSAVGANGVPVTVVNQISTVYPGATASAQGTTFSKVLSAATTNPTVVKASAARVYGWQLANTSAAWRYFKVYNMTTAPTVGTSVPAFVIPIPPGAVVDMQNAVPVTLGTGFAYAITAGPADADATAVAANDVVGHLLWV